MGASQFVRQEPVITALPPLADAALGIVLEPLSHPALGEIRIEESLFAIGRTEQPFASYGRSIVVELSRRHARIFRENDTVYVADLGSKNGTTVNRIAVREQPLALHEGDEICFGGALSYRVKMVAGARSFGLAPRLLSLILSPEHAAPGLKPLVIARFPFLISKADDAFSRHKDGNAEQFSYLSRRHAHIFLKGGAPFIEDLGSTNGTFVAGKRLDEHAVPLVDGDLLAFGGDHFTYRVRLEQELDLDPTVVKPTPRAPAAAPSVHVNQDKTTFVAAPDSFLEIFCVDHAPRQIDADDKAEVEQADTPKREADQGRPRGKLAILVSELREALAGDERDSKRGLLKWGASLAVAIGTLMIGLHLWGASERELKDLVASGDHGKAATLASQLVQRDPENAELKALETEAVLKANVPNWLTLLKARDFDGANTVLAGIQARGAHNADLRALVDKLEWIGSLQKLVIARGGVDARIRLYADEENIGAVLKRWDDDTHGHQRALARIASYVPEFKDPYAEALTQLRKLQTDDRAYLAAIERLKAIIGKALNRNDPESLEAVLKEHAENFPRLGGLDGVRRDVRQYIEIETEARAKRLSRLVTLLDKVQFATPPFQEKYRALAASGELPPADVVQQYQAVAKAWRAGDARQAFGALQTMAVGPWAEAVSRELEQKKTVAEQFLALQKARGTGGYPERLLAFYGSIDADEDGYFARAIEADVGLHKDRAIARAQQQLNRAQTLWRQYHENGAIEGKQRLAAEISNQFRAQAQSLAEAHQLAQQGIRIYTQLKVAHPTQWSKVQDEIKAEAELQRKALLELRNVLEPRVLKAKLALLSSAT